MKTTLTKKFDGQPLQIELPAGFKPGQEVHISISTSAPLEYEFWSDEEIDHIGRTGI